MLEDEAQRLHDLAAMGWRLREPVDGGHGELEPPALDNGVVISVNVVTGAIEVESGGWPADDRWWPVITSPGEPGCRSRTSPGTWDSPEGERPGGAARSGAVPGSLRLHLPPRHPGRVPGSPPPQTCGSRALWTAACLAAAGRALNRFHPQRPHVSQAAPRWGGKRRPGGSPTQIGRASLRKCHEAGVDLGAADVRQRRIPDQLEAAFAVWPPDVTRRPWVAALRVLSAARSSATG